MLSCIFSLALLCHLVASKTCTLECEHVFVDFCTKFQSSQGPAAAFNHCRKEIDTGASSPMVQAGCVRGCDSTEGMLLAGAGVSSPLVKPVKVKRSLPRAPTVLVQERSRRPKARNAKLRDVGLVYDQKPASGKECQPSCEKEFVDACIPARISQGYHSVEAFDQCRADVDSQSPPLRRAGCSKGCVSTLKMVAMMSGPVKKQPDPFDRLSSKEEKAVYKKQSDPFDRLSTQEGNVIRKATKKNGTSNLPPVACAKACETEFIESCLPFFILQGWDAQLAFNECRTGIDDLTSDALVAADCLQNCKSTGEMVAARMCTPSCEREFQLSCMPFYVLQGWDPQSAFDECRARIDSESSQPLQRAGCVKRCDATQPMLASGQGVMPGRPSPTSMPGAAGQPALPVALFEGQATAKPKNEVALVAPHADGFCDIGCEREFVLSCVPFHTKQGWKAGLAYEDCRSGIDHNATQLIKAGCDENCTSTHAMLAAGEDMVKKQCNASSVGPRSIVRYSSGLNGANRSRYGTPVLVGDSAFDGCGSTGGAVEWNLAVLLGTTVINNAQEGADMNTVYGTQTACSAIEDCLWSVVIVGMNPNSGEANIGMDDFVERELRAGKKVIIHGHPNPTPWAWDRPNKYWTQLLDSYEKIAAKYKGVYFVDSRHQPQWRSGMDFYDVDQFHPGPKGGVVFAEAVANVIIGQSGKVTSEDEESEQDEEDEGEEDEGEEDEDEEDVEQSDLEQAEGDGEEELPRYRSLGVRGVEQGKLRGTLVSETG